VAQLLARKQAFLQPILDRSAESWFGRRHRFRRAEDFRERVPLSRYEDYAEAIERIADGEDRVLTTDRVLLFEPTSGSLGGTKWIPSTAALKAEFQRALAPWVADLFGRRPGLMGGCSYWSESPVAGSRVVPEPRLRAGRDDLGWPLSLSPGRPGSGGGRSARLSSTSVRGTSWHGRPFRGKALDGRGGPGDSDRAPGGW
jgi:hypothetical protein